MTDNLDIPDFLRRRKGEAPTYKTDPAPARVIVMPDTRRLVARHKLRKLRTEERRLSKLIDDIGARDQTRRKRLYSLIREVELDISAREAEIAALQSEPTSSAQ